MSGVSGEAPKLSATEADRVIATLRDAYDAFNRGDLEAAVAGLDPQIEWSEPAEFPGGGTYHGRHEVKTYLSQSRAGFTEGGSEPEKFIPAGNRMVVFVHAHIRPKGREQWMDIRLADVYTIDRGRIAQMRAFADRGEALRWAGAGSYNKK